MALVVWEMGSGGSTCGAGRLERRSRGERVWDPGQVCGACLPCPRVHRGQEQGGLGDGWASPAHLGTKAWTHPRGSREPGSAGSAPGQRGGATSQGFPPTPPLGPSSVGDSASGAYGTSGLAGSLACPHSQGLRELGSQGVAPTPPPNPHWASQTKPPASVYRCRDIIDMIPVPREDR